MKITAFVSLLFLITQALVTTIHAQASAEDIPKKSESRKKAEEFGSLKNSKVAIKLSNPEQEIVYFTTAISAEEQQVLTKIVPNLKLVTGLSQVEAMSRAKEAHGADSRYATPEFLAKASNLAWIQVMSAGVDRHLSNDALMKNDSIVLTNFQAVHGPAIADHSMAMLLSLTRQLRFYTEMQKEQNWSRGNRNVKPISLDGKTMLVVGLGGIGSEIAQRANGFGMRVIGTRRSDKPSPDYIEKVGKPSDLIKMLPEADVVALAVPLTDETKNMMNTAAFEAMKQGSYLINIARGKVVNTDAMIAALKSGKLAGAGLDVTDPEPLTKGHPLWEFPNVVITPHMASRSNVTNERRAALLRENLRRFASGEPLFNVVDKVLGY